MLHRTRRAQIIDQYGSNLKLEISRCNGSQVKFITLKASNRLLTDHNRKHISLKRNRFFQTAFERFVHTLREHSPCWWQSAGNGGPACSWGHNAQVGYWSPWRGSCRRAAGGFRPQPCPERHGTIRGRPARWTTTRAPIPAASSPLAVCLVPEHLTRMRIVCLSCFANLLESFRSGSI